MFPVAAYSGVSGRKEANEPSVCGNDGAPHHQPENT